MGRLANAGGAAQQQWDEVNAGWGQAALLLVTISTKVGFSFSTYRIIPMGSFSKVGRVGGGVGWGRESDRETEL